MGQREYRTLVWPLHVSVYVRLFMLNMCASMKVCVHVCERERGQMFLV